eukprot:symbB.v1.2.022628.t1/scaffold2014.1/size92328/7
MAAVWEAAKCSPGSSLLIFHQNAIVESIHEDPSLWRSAVRLGLSHLEGEPHALLVAKGQDTLPAGMDHLQDVLKELGCSLQLVESLEGAPAASMVLLTPSLAKETFATLTKGRQLKEGCIVVLLGIPPEGVLHLHSEESPTLIFALGLENGKETLSTKRWEELRTMSGEGPSLCGLGIGQSGGCCCYFDGRLEVVEAPAIRLCPENEKIKWELVDPDENVEKLPKGLAPYASPMQTAADLLSGGDALAFTGAGISKESGVPTYRDGDGLWKRYDAMEVSSLSGLVGEPSKVWAFEREFKKILRGKSLGPNSDIAQQRFGIAVQSLVSADGRLLEGAKTLCNAALRDGDVITVVAQGARIVSNRGSSAFALIRDDGTVLTWGEPSRGGDSSSVEDQLINVQQVLSSWCSFAAIRTDGSVVTWGDPKFGGDSSMVQEKLIQVQQIAASRRAFAALLANGSVVTWGDPDTGGDSSDVQEQLKEVCQLEASYGAFGAILADGSVVAWGDIDTGGDCSKAFKQLKGVRQLRASHGSFAAILSDGHVVCWGNPDIDSESCKVPEGLCDVQEIQASGHAYKSS